MPSLLGGSPPLFTYLLLSFNGRFVEDRIVKVLVTGQTICRAIRHRYLDLLALGCPEYLLTLHYVGAYVGLKFMEGQPIVGPT